MNETQLQKKFTFNYWRFFFIQVLVFIFSILYHVDMSEIFYFFFLGNVNWDKSVRRAD